MIFVDRPLSDLIPTEDRPLAKNREALEALYCERLPRYLALCDERIEVGDLESTLETLEQKWRNA